MLRGRYLLVACVVLAVGAYAQAPAPVQAGPGDASAEMKAPAKVAEPAANEPAHAGKAGKAGKAEKAEKAEKKEAIPIPPGDVIHFKNGAQLPGVQVLRETPTEYIVEVVEGSVNLNIPRTQVESIDYDNVDPWSRPKKAGEGAGAGSNELPGRQLSPELTAKLSSDLSAEPLSYANEDLVTVLADLGKKLGISITASDAVKAMPAEKRLWTFKTTPGTTTLYTLLRDDLQSAFPDLEAVFLYDKIVVTTKEDAKNLRSEQATEPAGAPAAAPAAPANPVPGTGAPAGQAAPPIVPPAPGR